MASLSCRLLLAVLSPGNPQEAPAGGEAASIEDSHARMVAALEDIRARTDRENGYLGTAQAQHLREFASNAEEVLRRTGDLTLLDEAEDVLILRADGRFETSIDLSDQPSEVVTSAEARRPGLAVTEAKTIATYYDPADVLHWVTEALAERYPAVDFSAVYE